MAPWAGFYPSDIKPVTLRAAAERSGGNDMAGCSCGCSTTIIKTAVDDPCTCGCSCCNAEEATSESEISQLTVLRGAIDRRLAELGVAS
ncbi:MAG: hypothetical protein ACT4OS_03415 [Acidimicrobiales bacterium]